VRPDCCKDMEGKLAIARRVTSSLALLLLLADACAARDFSIREGLLLARRNDPIYLAARAKMEAALARRSQARSYLLPQLALKGTANQSDRRYETLNSIFGEPVSKTIYDGYSAQVTLSQALYRRANFLGISQANAALRQAEEEALAAEQDMLMRLVQAWLKSVAMEDALAHAESRRLAAQRKWDQLSKARDIDLASAPALAEARAVFEQAAAERIAAASEREARLSELEQIVGPLPAVEFPTLTFYYVPAVPPGRTLDQWLEVADADNPAVNAARAALLAASSEIRRQRAGHEPTLDIVGNYSFNRQDEGNFPGQSGYEILQNSIGIEFNMPIYSGGLQSAKVREAVAMRSQAEQELHGAMRTARAVTRTAWFAWQAGEARQSAGSRSVHAAALALRAATVGLAEEVNFDLEVLEAREQLLDAWSKAQQARDDMVQEALKLKAAPRVGPVATPDRRHQRRGALCLMARTAVPADGRSHRRRGTAARAERQYLHAGGPVAAGAARYVTSGRGGGDRAQGKSRRRATGRRRAAFR
jgi:outer membrane protein